MSIVATGHTISQGNSGDAPTRSGREFRNAFTSYWKAHKAGFLSKTAWAKKGRKIKPRQIPSLVIRQSGKVRGVCSWYCVLEDLGNDFFIVALDFYEVFYIDQTVPKATRKRNNSTPRARQSAFYIPVNFDSQAFPDHQRDLVHYFLNLLHWKWICWQADEEGFIRLKHDYLTKIIPKSDWQGIRSRLIDLGLIDWDENYCPGFKAQGYRRNADYHQTRRVVCTDDRLNRKIEKVYSEEHVDLLPVHDWLKKKLNVLDFDVELSRWIVPTMQPDEKRKQGDPAMSIGEYHLLLTDLCRRFVEEDFFFSCDRFGRVHTPVTSLPRQLRSCLLVDGQNLVGLDLANSQPLIAAICAKQFFKSRSSKCRLLKKTFEKRNPYCYRQLQEMARRAEAIVDNNETIHRKPTSNTTPKQALRITTEENLQVVDGSSTCDLAQLQHPAVEHEEKDGLQEYIELCELGQFYESLMELGEDRGEFKEKLYANVFFGKNQYRSKLKDRFEQRFPAVATMLRDLKERNYRLSSWLLQNYEATIFIYTICNRIRNEAPDLPVFTIHDSILTVPNAVEYVESVIMDEFSKLGITPTLKREDYGESNLHQQVA